MTAASLQPLNLHPGFWGWKGAGDTWDPNKIMFLNPHNSESNKDTLTIFNILIYQYALTKDREGITLNIINSLIL